MSVAVIATAIAESATYDKTRLPVCKKGLLERWKFSRRIVCSQLQFPIGSLLWVCFKLLGLDRTRGDGGRTEGTRRTEGTSLSPSGPRGCGAGVGLSLLLFST